MTFRQVDPLYTIGLADPTAPKVLGQLELLGYSAYLHPIADGLLLGVGQDATPEGRTKGVQVSLFGVGDPAHPKLLAQHALGAASSSQVEFDSHAFLYWAPRQLVVLPVQVFDAGARQAVVAGLHRRGRADRHPVGDRRGGPRRPRPGRRLRPADQPLDRHRRPAADGLRRRRAGERARRLRAGRVGGVPGARGRLESRLLRCATPKASSRGRSERWSQRPWRACRHMHHMDEDRPHAPEDDGAAPRNAARLPSPSVML